VSKGFGIGIGLVFGLIAAGVLVVGVIFVLCTGFGFFTFWGASKSQPKTFGQVAGAVGGAGGNFDEDKKPRPGSVGKVIKVAEKKKERKKATAKTQADRKKLIDEMVQKKIILAYGTNKRTGQEHVILVPDSFKSEKLEDRLFVVMLIYSYWYEAPAEPDFSEWIKEEPSSHAACVQELSGKIIADMIGGQYVDH